MIINAVSANAGGGLNDLVHTLPLLARRLEESGFAVTAFVADQGAQALRTEIGLDCQVQVVKANSPLARARWELWDLPHRVARTRAAAVFQFSNLLFRGMHAPQITVLRSLTFFSREYALQVRRGMYQRLRHGVGTSLSRSTIERAAVVFCISRTQQQEIISRYGHAGGKVRVSHLGIAVSAGMPQRPGDRTAGISALPEELRDRVALYLQGASHVLLNVAHYYQQKNFLTLLQGTELLAQRDPKLRLIITGGLLDYSGPAGEREKQEIALARRLSEHGVLVDLGPIPRQWVDPLMQVADVFVFPSSLEAFGHPLLEAMRAQLPVVASDTTIHREIAGEAASFHQVYDPASLAGAIDRLLQNARLRQQQVAAGLERIKRFSWARHVEDLVEAIVEVAKS